MPIERDFLNWDGPALPKAARLYFDQARLAGDVPLLPGTEFGERHYSAVSTVRFVRADARNPAALLGLRYNDRDGLIALGIDVDPEYPYYGYSEEYLRRSAAPFPAEDRRYAAPPDGWRWR